MINVRPYAIILVLGTPPKPPRTPRQRSALLGPGPWPQIPFSFPCLILEQCPLNSSVYIMSLTWLQGSCLCGALSTSSLGKFPARGEGVETLDPGYTIGFGLTPKPQTLRVTLQFLRILGLLRLWDVWLLKGDY